MGKRYTKPYRTRRKKNPLLPIMLALGGVLLILGVYFAFRGSNPSSRAAIEVIGAPSLRVDKEQVDLGDVRLGQTVSASFQLTNVGDKTLRFTRQPYIEVLEGC